MLNLIVLNPRKNNSSPGLDGIDYEILQKLPPKFQLLLLDIFNEMYKKGEYPTDWQHSFVHMIDKPGKNSVRPIALTSCVGKVFEGLVKSRLQWWAEHENILPKNQAGFRKGKSCNVNLAYLTLQIDQALANKKEVLATFLDVSDAFNNVLPNVLINRLLELKCSEQVIRFVKFLTFERFIHTNIEGDKTIKICKGVPQGGVLSPLLYLLYVSNISNKIDKDTTVLQFADDLVVYTTTTSREKGKGKLETSINVINANLLALGLELSPVKTIFVHFNKKNIFRAIFILKLITVKLKQAKPLNS